MKQYPGYRKSVQIIQPIMIQTFATYSILNLLQVLGRYLVVIAVYTRNGQDGDRSCHAGGRGYTCGGGGDDDDDGDEDYDGDDDGSCGGDDFVDGERDGGGPVA